MAFAFKRSIRQAISFVVAGVAAYLAWFESNAMMLFNGFPQLIVVGPYLAGVAAFFVFFYISMMLLKSKAAR